MDLATAKAYAAKISEWIAPHCHRIEVAGSIRRERPICNDIDFVVIPKVEIDRDMFDNETGRRIPLHELLTRYVAETPEARWVQGETLKPETKQFLLQLRKCQLDIFLADEETWGTRLLCRTGSKEHNIFLCERAKVLGLHWSPNEGLRLLKPGATIPRSEAEILDAMGLDWIEPREREI